LPPKKELLVPMDRRLGGPQSWYGCSGEEKNIPALLGIKSQSYTPQPCHYTE